MKIIVLANTRSKGLSVSLGPVSVLTVCLCIMSVFGLLFLSGARYANNHSAEMLDSIRQQTSSEWENEINKQGRELDEIKLKAEKSLDSMASRVSLLQGHIMRLDALGSRLATMAQLEDFEFGVDNPPGMGGPEAGGLQHSLNIPDFLFTLEELENNIQDRSEKLAAIESMLINRSLQEQTVPLGHPAQDGWLTSGFGFRTDPFTGKREPHQGLDIAGKEGTPIIALAAGIVTWSGPRYDFGNLVEIDHGNGYITRYAHNEKNLVSVGEKVDQGEVIAIMGNSGHSTGTHVHLEVLRNGSHVDPRKYVVLQ